MTKNEAINLFNTELQKTLLLTFFPNDCLPKNFNLYKHAAMQHESVRSINMDWSSYKQFLMKEKDYNLFEIAAICNVVESRTPHQLDPLLEENYYDVQERIKEVEVAWNAIVTPIKESINRKIEIMSTAGGQYKSKPLTLIQ